MNEVPQALFQHPALPAGPPSRGNWYQELLDDPGCQSNPVKVQEAYESNRQVAFAKNCSIFEAEGNSAFTPDATLQRYRKGELNDTEHGDVNCLVFWARPHLGVRNLIQELQQRLSFLGEGVYLVPLEHLHLSVLELSHRHTVEHLRSVQRAVGERTLREMVEYPFTVANDKGSMIRLGLPQLSFDRAGIALDFVPVSSQDDLKAASLTYRDLRNELHRKALSRGIEIDTCYTTATAHIAFARFVNGNFWQAAREKKTESSSPTKELLRFVQSTNQALRGSHQDSGFTTSCSFEWVVAGESGLEMQLGYVKYGRSNDSAAMTGRSLNSIRGDTPAPGFWNAVIRLFGFL